MAYASQTKVPIDRTIGEIQKVLHKAKADGFMFASIEGKACIGFNINGRSVRMKLSLVNKSSNKNNTEKNKADQINRAKWRGLLLCIKAKLESVESGIETFDQAFMPHIVLSSGETIGEKLLLAFNDLEEQSPHFLLGIY